MLRALSNKETNPITATISNNIIYGSKQRKLTTVDDTLRKEKISNEALSFETDKKQ